MASKQKLRGNTKIEKYVVPSIHIYLDCVYTKTLSVLMIAKFSFRLHGRYEFAT